MTKALHVLKYLFSATMLCLIIALGYFMISGI